MTRSPARQGPKKVWSGYKNLRVPVEIFDEIKDFLEKRKVSFLEGETQDVNKPDIENRLANIERKLDVLIQASTGEKLTARERVRQFLVSNPLIDYSTVEISEILGMARGTTRQVCRELYLEDKNIHLLEGRPNRYYFQD